MDEVLEEQRRAVYGASYEEAKHQMEVVSEQIKLQTDVGFKSEEECKQWAHEHQLDIVAFSPSAKLFFLVSHKGELLQPKAFSGYYGNILFFWRQNGPKLEKNPWIPESFDYYNNAKIPGEISDGTHEPLYYRDYTRPTGYYNAVKTCYNMAKPFPFFAKNTGRDTSHIYTLIEHIAGECAMWLLAWLRAKMVNPNSKTQVVPIIVSRAQGSGKTTFGEVICKGLFGKDNVLVTDQYDSQSRFNSDYADALIVCMEEKEETDKRNPVAAIKSRATATTIRKEQKGIDPIYQESYTDFLMTTNKDVPIKFEGREDQRRFMIMQADEHFTRKTSALADEVFSKLYGYDADGNKVGVPFTEDKELIEQFKHELFTREDIKSTPLRNFPKTAAYKRCYTLPRTSEGTEVESIMRALAPFILESLNKQQTITTLPESGDINSIIQYPGAMEYLEEKPGEKIVALCRPLVFYDLQTSKPYAHATVERCLIDCQGWLEEEFGLKLLPDADPLHGGFRGIAGRYKTAPAARFTLKSDFDDVYYSGLDRESGESKKAKPTTAERVGERFRVDDHFIAHPQGCYETVNELKPGIKTLHNKSKNVQYMDTFLFESDECTKVQEEIERGRVKQWKESNPDKPIPSLLLYKERLELGKAEALRLYSSGIACRVVYSGAKSYHTLVRVADEPKTLEEYSWLHAYLSTSLSSKLAFDPSTSDPGRLTRSPVSLKRRTYNTQYKVEVEGEQGLVAEDFSHIYSLQWRDLYEQWLQRPMKWYETKGRKLLPTKEIYREAMESLLAGTYWTDDDKWRGVRQETFFPAYRLLRSLGYSHEDLWTEDLLLANLSNYSKPTEIGYWRSRESSDIIRQIDEDYENADQ